MAREIEAAFAREKYKFLKEELSIYAPEILPDEYISTHEALLRFNTTIVHLYYLRSYRGIKCIKDGYKNLWSVRRLEYLFNLT